jgi:hypothetical protein
MPRTQSSRTILISSGHPLAENYERESSHFWVMGSFLGSGRPSKQMTRGMMMGSRWTLSWRPVTMMPTLPSR